MPTQPTNRAARRAKPAAKKAAPAQHVVKPKPLEKRVAKLEEDLATAAYLHAELSVFIKSYIARDVATKMGPALQEQLQARIMQQMNNGVRL